MCTSPELSVSVALLVLLVFFLANTLIYVGGGGGGVSDGDGIEAAEKYCNVTSSSSY